MTSSSRDFLKQLRQEIEQHPAVRHDFLRTLSQGTFPRERYRVFVEHHYPLVCVFTSYMELLLLRAPDNQARLWLAKVLVDEYGGGSDGKDHPALYEAFVQATGAWGSGAVPEPALAYIETHQTLVRERPFLEGLGAIGPGHEWAIPAMFGALLPGLERAGFGASEIDYFTLHLLQDCNHGAWLEEALVPYCGDGASQALVRRGALASLEARARFWSSLQERFFADAPGADRAASPSGPPLSALVARCRALQ